MADETPSTTTASVTPRTVDYPEWSTAMAVAARGDLKLLLSQRDKLEAEAQELRAKADMLEAEAEALQRVLEAVGYD